MTVKVLAEIKRFLNYDPITGVFTWIANTSPRQHRIGQVAGNLDINSGYRTVSVCNKKYYEHRLAWLFIHGEWPEEVDHINRNRSDNRICNLREVDRVKQMQNLPVRSDSTTGMTGVSISKRQAELGKPHWHAYIWVDRKRKHLGYHATFDEAAKARQEAEKVYFG